MLVFKESVDDEIFSLQYESEYHQADTNTFNKKKW